MNKKFQWRLIFIILVIAIIGYYFIHNKKIENPVAKIYKNGEVIKSIDLSTVKESYEIKIGDDEHYNLIRVSSNGIKVIDSTCHDKICMKTGEIHDSILPIACLPNNLIIKIQGERHDKFDTRTY